MSKLLNLRQTGRSATKLAFSNTKKTTSSSPSSSMMSSIFPQRTSFSMTHYKSALHTQVNVTRQNFDLKQAWRQPLKQQQQQHKRKQLRQQSTTSTTTTASVNDALTIDLLGWQVKVPKGMNMMVDELSTFSN